MTGEALLSLLLCAEPGSHVVIVADHINVSNDAMDRLVQACSGSLVATASPVPFAEAPATRVLDVSTHPELPLPPSLPLPCTMVCAVNVDSVHSIAGSLAGNHAAAAWPDTLAALGMALLDAGWRHVATPGVAARWDPLSTAFADGGGGAWREFTVSSMLSDANEGLAAHRLWIAAQTRGMRVIIDGACLTDDIHNGSQTLVLNVARALREARPAATVAVAVHREHIAAVGTRLAAEQVTVVRRDHHQFGRYDLVYRPYQLLSPEELPWLERVAPRLVVSQLDMIGFSNPSYHPSAALFQSVRNLQRLTMRQADAVLFISDFGRQTANAECPDLEARRCAVVWCGTDATPAVPDQRPADLAVDGPFVLCLSATFWHKNRAHAIRTFGEMCRLHDYSGLLVLAGPEPFYGRSSTAEVSAEDGMPAAVRSRIRRVGRVEESSRWWLLAHADVVLYPSVVEGFGLVPFEAAAVGTPSLSFNGTALGEVIGDSPVLVSSWSAVHWADAAAQLLAADQAAAAVAMIEDVASRHRWVDVAERTWTAFDQVVAMPRRARFTQEGGTTGRRARSGIQRTDRVRHLLSRVQAFAARRLSRDG